MTGEAILAELEGLRKAEIRLAKELEETKARIEFLRRKLFTGEYEANYDY